jgi:toxin ParE1/3/4
MVPRHLVKDRAAEEDLISIWLYTSDHWGAEQADLYLRLIERGLHALIERPVLGRDRGDVRADYRSLRIEQRVVFYTFTRTELRVRRVLHVAMDLEQHL